MRNARFVAPLAQMAKLGFLLSACALHVPHLSAAEQEDLGWFQWRGPTRDAKLATRMLPQDLTDRSLHLDWRVDLGPSYSGPIVTKDKIFVTETEDEQYEVVRAFDRSTGKQLWSTRWSGSLTVPFFASANGSWIRATPAYDGQYLYVAGIRDRLVCLNAATGAEVWNVDFMSQLRSPLPRFGCVSSPLVWGDHVYVQAGSGFVKMDKRSGRIVWRTLRDQGGMYGSAFSSPIMAELGGKRQLLVQTRRLLAGVDPEQGSVLWSREITAFRGMNILTPVVVGDAVFTSAYGGRSHLFRLQERQGSLGVEALWESKVQAYMSSPVVIDGYAYVHLRNQRLTCIDLKTGRTTFTTRPFGKYWSMVATADRILALDQRGELLLIRANPEKFELLGRRKISNDETWAHLAIHGDQIVVRELNGLMSLRFQPNLPVKATLEDAAE
ncbi:MAG: PQQ-binding-like beta-propeller repeat protein [Planctomycetota bacterium]|nr:PQQ-binding-like beta-propeller repeat protein [Planctomycetota bacterium]